MIRDLSATLQAILSDPVMTGPFPELSHALIAFDRPDDTFRPTQTMLDLFLFDVRENMELRSNEPRMGRQNGQVLINQAPMRVACTYLITAWPVGGTELALQEQRLLTQALQVLASCPRIPAPFLKGKLVGQEPPLPMMSAHHADELKNPAEFWAAIGNRMRASVTVTATISLDVFPLASVPMAKSAMVRFGERVVGAEQLTAATKSEILLHRGQGDQSQQSGRRRRCDCRRFASRGAHRRRRQICPRRDFSWELYAQCAIGRRHAAGRHHRSRARKPRLRR